MWCNFKLFGSPSPLVRSHTVSKMLTQVAGQCPQTMLGNHPFLPPSDTVWLRKGWATLCSWPGPEWFKPVTVSSFYHDWFKMDIRTNLSQEEEGCLSKDLYKNSQSRPLLFPQCSSRTSVSLQSAAAICEKEKKSWEWGQAQCVHLKTKPALQKAEWKRKIRFWLQCMCYWIKRCLNIKVSLNLLGLWAKNYPPHPPFLLNFIWVVFFSLLQSRYS